eukprot:3854297-Pleurochrysis_carterae.AAC.1
MLGRGAEGRWLVRKGDGRGLRGVQRFLRTTREFAWALMRDVEGQTTLGWQEATKRGSIWWKKSPNI